MVVAQDPAAAVQRVLVQVAGGSRLAQPRRPMARLLAEVRVAVVVAQDAAAAGQGVLVQVARGPRLAQPAQGDGEVIGGGQGAGMVVAQDAAAATPPTPGPPRHD